MRLLALLLLLAFAQIGLVSYALDPKDVTVESKSEKLQSTDGSYTIEANRDANYRCRKDKYIMSYTIFSSENKGCALTYGKMNCTKLNGENCEETQTIQEEKVIASARTERDFCINKLNPMLEKFRTQGFVCNKME